MTTLLVSEMFNVTVAGSKRCIEETDECLIGCNWEHRFPERAVNSIGLVLFPDSSMAKPCFICTSMSLFMAIGSIVMKCTQHGQQVLILPSFLHRNSTLDPELLSLELKSVHEVF